jgi:hypothetical protein
MAMRLKTIEYAFQSVNSDVALNSGYTWAARTLYIPETSSRTFRSVHAEVTFRINSTGGSGANVQNISCQVKLGTGSFSGPTINEPAVTPVFNHLPTYRYVFNLTSQFSSGFGSGASQTAQIKVQTSSSNTVIGLSCKLVITYEYDDSSASTRIKTVRIPIESISGALSQNYASIGNNQIPALDSFLPESGKVYRQIFLETFANETNTDTVAFPVRIQIDNYSERNCGTRQFPLASSAWFYDIYDITSVISTSSTHNIQAALGFTIMTRVARFGGVLTITYEYDHSSSSTIINSVMIPFTPSRQDAVVSSYFDSTGENVRARIPVYIPEGGTISLRQSGYVLTWTNYDAQNIASRAGGQSFSVLSSPSMTSSVAPQSVVRRIDSGGLAGTAGFSPSHGNNEIVIDMHRYLPNISISDLLFSKMRQALSGILYLNYTCSKHSLGDGAHLHTVAHLITQTASENYPVQISATAPSIPETKYWISSVGLASHFISDGSDKRVMTFFLYAQDDSSSYQMLDLITESFYSLGIFSTFWALDVTRFFKRFPNDPAPGRNDVETQRAYRIYASATTTWPALVMYVTYHSISKEVSGQLYYYSGSGANIPVMVHRADTGELVATGQTSSGGQFSVTVYDDTIQYFVTARQDNDRVGRSSDGEAT